MTPPQNGNGNGPPDKRKATGLETGLPVKVKDHPAKDFFRKWQGLGPDDPVPATKEREYPKKIEFTHTIENNEVKITSLTVELDAYSYRIENGEVVSVEKVEVGDDLKTITWGETETPPIPAEDELDADGNVITPAGAIRKAVPAFATLVASDPQIETLLNGARQKLFQLIRQLVPAWKDGVEK